MAATPALQSPPRMVVPSVWTSSPMMRGLMPRPGLTVSMCAESMRGSEPSSEASRLPWASRLMMKPRSVRRRSRSWAISSSSPEGESICTMSQKVVMRRSLSIMSASVSWVALVALYSTECAA